MKFKAWLLMLCIPTLALASGLESSSSIADAKSAEIQQLKQQLARISMRLDALERTSAAPTASLPAGTNIEPDANAAALAAASSSLVTATSGPNPAVNSEDSTTRDFFRATTVNFGLDGYYGYNFNEPIGRVNLLRAYDVSSNSFSISQASVVVEHLPRPEPGRRAGGRVDLQFGQATETLQGSSANEQRPQVWRNLFQAYGSYLAPVGNGLQIDFGKFSSSLGVEGNYTKDQVTYSRAYLFNYLPFYHTGLRANYAVSSKANVAYWLVNGAQQTEDFNGFKSQAFLFTLKPASSVSWNVNYYFGDEQRDVGQSLYPGIPTAPTQPGLPTVNISPAPNGREHIFDTYATWNATPRLTLIGEGDYVINRTQAESAPGHVAAGAVYAKYALPGGWNLGGRGEYFDDRSGLFSGTSQALKEVTVSLDRTFEPGFLARAEYRRDFSNQAFFLTDTPARLSQSQSTATLGLLFWWGTKQGSW